MRLSLATPAVLVALMGCTESRCERAGGRCDVPTDGADASEPEVVDTETPDTIEETDRVEGTDGWEDTVVVDRDTDLMDSPVDSESDVPVDSDVPDESDPPVSTPCVGALADYFTWEPGPPTSTDLGTLAELDAWQCAVDPATATTCPMYSGTCTNQGRAMTFVRLRNGETYAYAFYDDGGTLVSVYLHTDVPEYCDHTSWDESFGEPLEIGCSGAIFPFDEPECGVPLSCASPP
jgi:hypothetical protein